MKDDEKSIMSFKQMIKDLINDIKEWWNEKWK